MKLGVGPWLMANYGSRQVEAAERALQLADVLSQVELRDIAEVLRNYSKVTVFLLLMLSL